MYSHYFPIVLYHFHWNKTKKQSIIVHPPQKIHVFHGSHLGWPGAGLTHSSKAIAQEAAGNVSGGIAPSYRKFHREYHGIPWNIMAYDASVDLGLSGFLQRLSVSEHWLWTYGSKKRNIAGSYGCSSPISTVQQILTEDDMFSWLSTPLQGLEINLGTSVTHLSPSSLIASCVHELGIIILGSIANDWGYNNWVNNYWVK